MNKSSEVYAFWTEGTDTTPIVIDGIIYQTGALNHAWAIDGRTGRQIWRYQRLLPPTQDLKVCCGLVNRGFAVLGNRLFMTTLDAHLVALDRKTGKEVWDVRSPTTRPAMRPRLRRSS